MSRWASGSRRSGGAGTRPPNGWAPGALAALVPPPGTARLFASVIFVSSVGAGAFISVSTVYLIRVVGLSAGMVGSGLSAAGAVGLFTSVPLGSVADRIPPRNLLIALTVTFATLLCGYTQVRSFPAFLAIACLIAICQSGIAPVRGALTAELVAEGERVRIASHLRSATNLGIVLGSMSGGLVLLTGPGATSYRALMVSDAAALLVAALLLLRLPARALVQPGPAASRQPWWSVLRDGPFLAFTAQYAILALTNVVYVVGAPLWILERTHASTWVVAGLMLINCVAVALFQVRIGSRVSSLEDSRNILLRGGLVLAAACVPFVISASVGRLWADLALLVAGVVMAYGEMQVAAGSWGMAYGLAPEGRHGAYQGVFGLGLNAATLIGPLGITMLVVYLGQAGWLILGGAFVLAGCLTPWTLRLALAHPARTSQEVQL
jgi:MFS family permease